MRLDVDGSGLLVSTHQTQAQHPWSQAWNMDVDFQNTLDSYTGSQEQKTCLQEFKGYNIQFTESTVISNPITKETTKNAAGLQRQHGPWLKPSPSCVFDLMGHDRNIVDFMNILLSKKPNVKKTSSEKVGLRCACFLTCGQGVVEGLQGRTAQGQAGIWVWQTLAGRSAIPGSLARMQAVSRVETSPSCPPQERHRATAYVALFCQEGGRLGILPFQELFPSVALHLLCQFSTFS